LIQVGKQAAPEAHKKRVIKKQNAIKNFEFSILIIF